MYYAAIEDPEFNFYEYYFLSSAKINFKENQIEPYCSTFVV